MKSIQSILDNSSLKELNLIINATYDNKKKSLNELKNTFSEEDLNIIFDQYNHKRRSFTALIKSNVKKLKSAAGLPYKGEILVADIGYSCQIIAFYQVVRTSNHFIWIKPVDKAMVPNKRKDNQQAYVLPVLTYDFSISNLETKVLKKKIQKNEDSYMIKIDDYSFAKPWNGQPVYQDSCD